MRSETSAFGKSRGRRYVEDTSEIRILDKVMRLWVTLWSYPQVIHSLITDFMGLTKVEDTEDFLFGRYPRLGILDLRA
jgi:hypothetical protein|tara:strand:+ start:2640 stop:2873 length:234 start_codon:yes stop_codon:yes gene_type:complete